jgi:hypothetical protein
MGASGTALAIGGGAALGGIFGLMGSSQQASAAESAADTQAAASRYAADLQYKMWLQQQQLLSPWRTSGQNALNQLNWMMGLPTGTIPGTTTAATGGATQPSVNAFTSGYPAYQPSTDPNAAFDPTAALTTMNQQDAFRRGFQGIGRNVVDPDASRGASLFQGGGYGGLRTGPVVPTAPTGGTTDSANALAGGASLYTGDPAQQGILTQRFGADQYMEDPGYKFRLEQGINALTAAGAAGGYLGSGNLGTALIGYGQEMGSQEYQNAYNRYMAENEALYNRLAGISGTGQTSSEYLAGAGGTAAANMGNLAVGGANALAAGQTGAANAWAGGLQNISNQFMGGLGTYLNYQQQQQMINAWKNSQGVSPYATSNALVAPSAYDTWSSWDYSGTPVVGGGTY